MNKTAKTAIILAVATFLICGCATVPEKTPIIKPNDNYNLCQALFPQKPIKVVHRIEGDFKGGRKSSLLGVTKTGPNPGDIETVLVTVEGMVLFEASRINGRLNIKRGLPPFDSEGFAAGLLSDVELMLLPPRGEAVAAGLDPGGRQLCRWRTAKGELLDVKINPDGGWYVFLYDAGGRLIREVEAKPPVQNGLAHMTVLKAHGPAEYQIRATLHEVND